jgi:ATP-binding cassette subfamily B protein
MGTRDASAAKAAQTGPVSQILRPIRGRLLASAVLAATGSALMLVPLAGIAQIVATVLGGHGLQVFPVPAGTGVLALALISVAGMFLGMALLFAGELTAHLADNQLTHRLQLEAAQRLSRVPLGWFTSRGAGEVKQAMQDDIATLHALTAHFYTAVGRAAGTITVSVLYLFVLDWRMALVALLPFPGFFLFLRHAMKASAGNMQDFAARLGRLNGATAEFVSGIPVLKAFAASGQAHGSYRQAVDGFAQAFIRFTRPLVSAMAHAHAMIAPVTVLGVVLGFGTLFAALGWIAPLDVLPFALVAPGICAPMLLLHTLLHDLGGANAAARRVLALLQTPVLDTAPPGQQRIPAGHEVRFENVSHAHGGEHRVLSGLSFTLPAGSVTAVVGASGAGKSTLARLLLRFHDPDQGRVTLGGVDLRHIETSQLSRRIGFVLQEVRLIHASVRENIALGRPSASRQEIEEAARAAHIHERILALPRGYDSVVGEDAQLSGGERQRVTIARAVLLDPPVLVLDEATAAADAGNEVMLQDALSRFAQGRTLLVIAHRLDTVMHADRILVLHEGALVEQGTHGQLLALQGRYARMWRLGGYGRDARDARDARDGQGRDEEGRTAAQEPAC